MMGYYILDYASAVLVFRDGKGAWIMAQRAPGKHYREGISLIELFEMFPDDAAAARWFEERRWGAAGTPSHCPLCGGAAKLRPVPSGRPLPYWCGGCRRNFSVRSGTVMHRSRIGLQKWAIAIYLWSTSLKGVSSMKLHRDLGITQKSAYFLAQRLREAWSGTPSGMTGPVEVDEVYIGGLRENMPRRKRKTLKGRGPVGKAVVAGARDRATNRIGAAVVETPDRRTLHRFIAERAAPEARVYTDDYVVYRGMPYDHEAVRHVDGEYVRGDVHTPGHRVLLGHAEAGPQGHLPSYLAQTPAPLRQRICDTPQHARARYANDDGRYRCPDGRQTPDLPGPGGLSPMAPNRTPDAPGAKPDKGPPSNIALPPVDASPSAIARAIFSHKPDRKPAGRNQGKPGAA